MCHVVYLLDGSLSGLPSALNITPLLDHGFEAPLCVDTFLALPINTHLVDPLLQWRIHDLMKGGRPKIFWVNFSQFRGFFTVFGENRGGGRLLTPPPPLDPPPPYWNQPNTTGAD